MNREFSKNVFVSSRLYQSKDSFVKVSFREEAEEYSEKILEMFGRETENKDEDFYGSFFIGSIFHSLLNTGNSRRRKHAKETPQPQLYFLQENLTGIDNVLVTHIARLVEKENGLKVLHVRSLFTLKDEMFIGLKDKLVENIKQTRFQCYLPDNVAVDEVQAESIVISTKDKNGSDFYVISPDYLVDPCESQEIGPKFIEIPKPTGEASVYDDLSKYLDDSVETLEEKEMLYGNLMKSLFNVSNLATSLLSTVSHIPFIYGLLYSNVKQTYELNLKIDKLGNSILFVPKRNSKGQKTFYGVPSIITQKPDLQHNDFLHRSAVHSLTKQALIASENSEGTIKTGSVTLPKFKGILHALGENIEPISIENVIRFIYHNNRIASSTIEQPATHANFHFVSNFILGELLSQIEHSFFEIFVFAPETNSNDKQRLNAQRVFFLRDPENGSSIILNIIESSMSDASGSQFEFNPNVPTDIQSIPDVEISNLNVIQINLNPNSVNGWNDEEDGFLKPSENYFWQSVRITNEDHRFFTRDPNAYLKLEVSTMQFTPAFSFSKDFITDMFSKLKENRLQLLINVDQDLQSVVMGILMGASTLVEPNIDGITTTLRHFVEDENEGLADLPNIPTKLSILSVAKEGVVIPQTEQVLLANLKSVTVEDQKNDEIDAKMKEATDELKKYQCSRDEKLKEVDKVSSVPAVYDSSELAQDPNRKRVYFEVDPETLSEMNCTATENPFREFLKNHKPPEKEGDNKKEGFFDRIKSKFTKYIYGNPNAGDGQMNVHVEKCHLGAWTDGQYSMDGITCNSGKSRIAVFRNIEPNDLVRMASRGDPFHLVGDDYKSNECSPISFNGRESVVCKGEKSTLIYTPYFEPRLFDELDGNLMLGQVVMHLGSKLWRFVRREGVSGVGGEEHLVTEEMVGLWENAIRDVTDLIGKWEGDGGAVDWARENLEECREMIENFKDKWSVSAERVEVITERLLALKEDLSEQILFGKVENMFGEKMEGGRKEFGDGEGRNRFYGGSLSTGFGNSGVGMAYGNGGQGQFTNLG